MIASPLAPFAERQAWPPYLPEVAEAVFAALSAPLTGTSVLDGVSDDDPINAFESRFADLVDARFALATNSGAAALHLALLAGGVGPGDEVILPAYGWGQILVFLDALDAVPVFADVDASWCLDPASVAERVTPRTRAIVAIHVAGRPASMPALREIADAAPAFLIEDACSALGATIAGRPVGSFGDAAAFSFGPRKHLPCGEGGMLVTHDRAVWEAAMAAGSHPHRFARHARTPAAAPNHETFWPYRIHPLAAVIGLATVPSLAAWHAARSHRLRRLCQTLLEEGAVAPLAGWNDPGHAWGALLVQTEDPRESPSVLLPDLRPGPVRVPLHRRPGVLARWGTSPPCPVAENACRLERWFPDAVACIGSRP
ncbi:MAG: DegT/DnrJ/EryC1/StrS family aminotransferase [Fimbriimonadaceae bacterium]|nr:DegT/DnrJ/EryC1/StrS family aminotransferase [Fimbriimonadaceae bacterium]